MTSNNNSTRRDLFATVTEQIVSALEAGCKPWVRPWNAASPISVSRPLRSTGEPYRGINVLLLWGTALERGYCSNQWFTFMQAKAAGAHVRRGEQGAMVVFSGRVERNDDPEDESDGARERKLGGMFLRAYTVFNAEQLEGLPDSVRETTLEDSQALQTDAQQFFGRIDAEVRHGGDRAFYAPGADFVQLPPLSAFKSSDAYCATRAHELIHWTGHPSRLARQFGQRFGDAAYAFEELVAELGAAFVCADLVIAAEARADHAGYLQSWLRVLRADKRAIFAAAAHAQRAADYLWDDEGAGHA